MTTDQDVQLGPVDYLVIEFPGSKFNGEMLPALADLVDNGTIRILDLLIITKEADGSIDAAELSDFGDDLLEAIRMDETALAMLLSEDDVTKVAEAMEPGSTAGVLIYENLWAIPFANAARRAGGELIASGRIPIQQLLAAIEDDQEGD